MQYKLKTTRRADLSRRRNERSDQAKYELEKQVSMHGDAQSERACPLVHDVRREQKIIVSPLKARDLAQSKTLDISVLTDTIKGVSQKMIHCMQSLFKNYAMCFTNCYKRIFSTLYQMLPMQDQSYERLGSPVIR